MCCSTCYCFAVCQGARDEEAQACKVQEEITRLGQLALALVREGEGDGAHFSNHLKRQAYKAAGVELPEYLAEPGVCIYCKGQVVDCRCVSCGEAG